MIASEYFGTSNVGRLGDEVARTKFDYSDRSEDHLLDITSIDPLYRRMNGLDDITPDLFEHKE